ncbi:MAG: FAD-binding protein [Chitinophagaceae bacterium]|nr:MAG: FAD-binding protein [Chitinophagaceae bacterium]
MQIKKIGIIGAGLSGLATAKAFKERGHNVTIFEKAAEVGGVWERSRSYINLTTQTTKNEYAFSDYPMPEAFPEWPTGENMSAYLTGFSKHFGLLRHIQFNSTVLNMEFDGSQWMLVVKNEADKKESHQYFDFVVVCTGTFHEKYVPSFDGMDNFIANGGEVLHSSEVRNESQLRNKNVTVIGFAKSATDIACTAADLSLSSTLIYRKAQWKVPRFFANKVNLKYLLFSRFSEAFFLPYRKTGFQKILHSIGRPMVWMQWRGIEMLLKKQFKLKECGMLPGHSIETQISCSLGIAPEGFYDKVLSKKIDARHDEINYFSSTGVQLKKGAHVKTDLVIFGTGFKQSLPFIPASMQSILRNEDGQFELYRNIINPNIPRLGFVGFNSSLFSTLTSEVAANWLAEYVNGNIVLPGEEKLREEYELINKWKKQTRPIAAEFSGLCVAPFNFQHLDVLLKDMGLKTRASNNFLLEFFKPISPKDYQKLLLEKRPAIISSTIDRFFPSVKEPEMVQR